MLPARGFVLSNKGRWKTELGLYTATPGQGKLNPSTGGKLMLSLENLIINISLQLFSLTLVPTPARSLCANLRMLPMSAAKSVTLLHEFSLPHSSCTRGTDIPSFLTLKRTTNPRFYPLEVFAKGGCGAEGNEMGARTIYIFLDVPFIGNTSVAFPELLMEN